MDIYEDYEALLDEDSINPEEEAFMRGYDMKYNKKEEE